MKRFKEVLGSEIKRVGPVKTVLPMKDGSVGVSSKTREQKEEIMRLGQRAEDMRVKEREKIARAARRQSSST